jgi:hypothetical protein
MLLRTRASRCWLACVLRTCISHYTHCQQTFCVPAKLWDVKRRIHILQILRFDPEARTDHKLSANKYLYFLKKTSICTYACMLYLYVKTSRNRPWRPIGCEMLRITHCLGNRLTVNCEILATCSSTYSPVRTSLEAHSVSIK